MLWVCDDVMSPPLRCVSYAVSDGFLSGVTWKQTTHFVYRENMSGGFFFGGVMDRDIDTLCEYCYLYLNTHKNDEIWFWVYHLFYTMFLHHCSIVSHCFFKLTKKHHCIIFYMKHHVNTMDYEYSLTKMYNDIIPWVFALFAKKYHGTIIVF